MSAKQALKQAAGLAAQRLAEVSGNPFLPLSVGCSIAMERLLDGAPRDEVVVLAALVDEIVRGEVPPAALRAMDRFGVLLFTEGEKHDCVFSDMLNSAGRMAGAPEEATDIVAHWAGVFVECDCCADWRAGTMFVRRMRELAGPEAAFLGATAQAGCSRSEP